MSKVRKLPTFTVGSQTNSDRTVNPPYDKKHVYTELTQEQIKKQIKKYTKYFPIDVYDNFKNFVYYRYPEIADDVFNALVHTTYNIHNTRTNALYSITEDAKMFVLKFAEELRKLNETYYKQDTINIEKELLKQIKIPYQFYAEEEFLYFKTENNKMYMTELYFDYFEIFEVDTSDWDDCPKVSKGSVDAEEFLYENRGEVNKWNYYKIIKENGFYCALYRVLTNKNVFKHKFDIIEYRDGKIYTKDNKNKFTVELNYLNVMYWYNKKF